jgi:aspartyl-tRNA synthetase
MKNNCTHISTEQIDVLAENDNEFKKELIEIFINQTTEFSGNMQKFLEQENWEMLAKEAHTAKSSVLLFGMNETGKLLKDIQLNCQNNEHSEVPQMTKDATDQIKSVIPELKQLLESL